MGLATSASRLAGVALIASLFQPHFVGLATPASPQKRQIRQSEIVNADLEVTSD